MMEGKASKATALSVALQDLSDEEILEFILDMHKPSKNPVVRWLWTGLGSIFVVFAAIGTMFLGGPRRRGL